MGNDNLPLRATKGATKKVYGELENVLLTDEEYGKLKQKFPDDFEDRINAVGFYIASSGKKYKSHYATVLMWDRRDKEKEKRGSSPQRKVKGTAFSNFEQSKSDYSSLEKRALDKLMNRRRV